ncbi:hypothetical protein HY745_13015 [Candidatus Desantisbacteria bacterium]|nr:hypothetical protein [Candidatus Desantisbacteria bacterium]
MENLISFVIPARNDNYMGNANWRLETTINFLAMTLERLGRLKDAEIVIADWWSDVPLHSVLSLTEQAKQITRFILIPITSFENLKFDNNFPTPIVMNLAIRRSKGTFIMQTLADVLWDDISLKRLFNILDGKQKQKILLEKTLFVFNRKELQYDMVCQKPSIFFLDKFIKENRENIPAVPPVPYTYGPSDGIMMHRDLWFECHAFDEKYQLWGWSDSDLLLRIQISNYFLFTCYDEKDMFIYHLNHIPEDQLYKVMKDKKKNPFFFNPLVVNDESWGLANYSFKEYPPVSVPVNVNNSLPAKTLKPDKYYKWKHFKCLLIFFMKNIRFRSIVILYYCTKVIFFVYKKDIYYILEDNKFYSTIRNIKAKMKYKV